MRYMLYDCNEDLVPLDQEIKYLQNYLELEKFRKGSNNEIILQVDGNPEGKSIAPLLLIDRKSTRLNSSHVAISYAVFCLKKKKKEKKKHLLIERYIKCHEKKGEMIAQILR